MASVDSLRKFLLLALVCGTVMVSVARASCGDLVSCHACITSSNPKCNWCEESKAGKSRCLEEKNAEGNCTTGSLQDLKSGYREPREKDRDPVMTIEPQSPTVKIRAGDTVRLALKVKIQNTQPVDLYYLTDISGSMDDDMKNIKLMAETLGEKIGGVTDSLAVGFGTFVDKKELPFYDALSSASSQKPPSRHCNGAYGFCNALPITNYSAERFTDVVAKTNVMVNQDAPEGGFDALLQVLRCDEIKWRPNSRRVLLFATDAPFHYAGAGRLAGISRSHDGKCHMKSGAYSESSTMDYPSVWQVSNASKAIEANIVFAVVESIKPLYVRLAEQIKNAIATTLDSDSSNIANVIIEALERITSKFEFTAWTTTTQTKVPDYLNVTFENNCPNGDKQGVCEGLKNGDNATITAKITFPECTENVTETLNINIGHADLNKSTQVTVKFLCTCNCKSNGDSREECSNNGSFDCGTCHCDEGTSGRNCSCQINTDQSTEDCKLAGTGQVCADQGQCICGECLCNTFRSADHGNDEFKYCPSTKCLESDVSCGPSADNLCNKHGECRCGECSCNQDYSGSLCDCAAATDKCETGGTTGLCSGNGTCRCNRCECDLNNGQFWFFGDKCEKCRVCGDLCKGENSLLPCVKYHWHTNGTLTNFVSDANVAQYKAACKMESITYIVLTAEEVDMEGIKNRTSQCTATDDKGKCKKVFWYDQPTAEKNYIVYYTADIAECESKIWYIVGGVLMAVIVLAALLGVLIWLFTRYRVNKKEVQAFKEDLGGTPTVNMNVIYEDPNKKTVNPLYVESDPTESSDL